MYKLCVFDLDGTICDTVESIAHSANHALRDLGLKEATHEDYKRFVGDGVDALVRRLLRMNGDTEYTRFAELRQGYLHYFETGSTYQVTAYPGVEGALEMLKKQGAILTVFSNKPHENTVAVVEKVFGKGRFDYLLGQTERFPRKPSPDGALHIAEHFGVKPEECLYIGDTGTDMKTGTAAGMHTVGVLWGFRERQELLENGAQDIVAEASEIPRIYSGEY